MPPELKRELTLHLVPTATLTLLLSLIWLLKESPFFSFLSLFLGMGLGSFLLDLDHPVYWFVPHPNLPESQEAKKILLSKNYPQLLAHLAHYHLSHNNLTFHHFHFQLLLLPLTFFILSSTSSIFAKSLVFSLNLHLLSDCLKDFYLRRQDLKIWLFARSHLVRLTDKALELYLLLLSSCLFLFFLFLLNS